MPREIVVLPDYALQEREERARLYGRAFEAGAQGIAQALLVYKQAADQESKEKIALLSSMVTQYKDRTPQPILAGLDTELRKRYKFGLPKDESTGQFMTPTPTMEEQIDREGLKDPNFVKGAAQKKFMGMSPIEQTMQNKKLDAQNAHAHAMEVHAEAMLEESRYRSRLAEMKMGDATGDTTLVRLPDGTIRGLNEVVVPETGQLDPKKAPPGTQLLKGKDADRAMKAWEIRVNDGTKQAQLELRKTQIALEQQRVATYITWDAGAHAWSALVKYNDPKETDESKARLKPYLTHVMDDALKHDYPDDKARAAKVEEYLNPKTEAGMSLFEYFAHLKTTIFGDNKTLQQHIENEQLIKGITPSDVPGEKKTTDGRVFRKTSAGRQLEVTQVPETGYPSPAPASPSGADVGMVPIPNPGRRGPGTLMAPATNAEVSVDPGE